MLFRVNAGTLPGDNWVFDEAHSERRIIGEACHFIDLFRWLSESEAVNVFATSLGSCPSARRVEDLTATIEFQNGSIASLIYTAVGSKHIGKERLEVFCDGTSVVVDDYKQLAVRGSERIDQRSRRADKGHDTEFEHFVDVVTGKEKPMITYHDGIQATKVCIAMIESARSGSPVTMEQTVAID